MGIFLWGFFAFSFACPQFLVLFVSKALIIIAFRFEELIEVRLAVNIPTQRCICPKAVQENTKSNVSILYLSHRARCIF